MRRFSRLWVAAIFPIAIAALSCKSDSSAAPSGPASVTFPNSFLWGTATAAFQIEKGDVNTDWSAWVNLTPSKIKNGDKPDDGGPDALNHIDDDIALMQQMGVNSYRFSIEWGRLFPTAAAANSATPDPSALAAYDGEMQKLQNAHITPMVTLQHFALPNWLSDVTQPNNPQGWENESTTDAFVKFCSWAGAHYGSQVDWWVTINEPLVTAVIGYVQGGSPPGTVLAADRAFAAIKAMARAHAKCFDALHAADTVDADGDGKPALVSVAAHLRTFHPLDPTDSDDVSATARVHYLWNMWFLNATILGNWDDDLDGNYTGPNDLQGDASLKGRMDYVGVNYYSDTLIGAHSGGIVIPIVNAAVIQDHLPTDRPKTDVAWDIYPEGLRTILDQDVAPYKLPVVITENGIADRADQNRARFLGEHLYQLGWSMQDGVDVRGYFHWSLMDNFEWQNGFCPNFGFASVDKTTAARTLRASGAAYKKIIGAKSISTADIASLPAYVAPSYCE
jgi:beta-glucosidase